MGAQHPRAGGVERHHPHRAHPAADQQLGPVAHLPRRLVGERDREDLVRLGRVGRDQVGDPVGQHAGLARAGAGEDQQRALAVGDRLALGLVEPGEQGVELGGGVGHGQIFNGSEAVVVAGAVHVTASVGRERPADRAPIRLRGRRRAGQHVRDRARARSPPTRHRCRSTGPPRDPDPEAHLLDGTPRGAGGVLADARRDQLRLGLVPDAAQARPAGPATSRSRPACGTGSPPTGRGPPHELDADRRREIAAALGQDPDHELMALFARSLNDLGRTSPPTHGGRFAGVVDAAGGSAVALARAPGRMGVLRRQLALRRADGPVPQARPDRRRRSRARRRRRVRATSIG